MNTDEKIDEFEKVIVDNLPAVDCPVTHKFVKGLYIREIFMPAGVTITSLIHKTNHPYFVMAGKVSVYSDNFGEQYIEAPFMGITEPNTRRVLYIHEDCVWITCHPTEIQPKNDSEEAIEEAVLKLRNEIIEPHENKLLGGTIINNILTKSLKP